METPHGPYPEQAWALFFRPLLCLVRFSFSLGAHRISLHIFVHFCLLLHTQLLEGSPDLCLLKYLAPCLTQKVLNKSFKQILLVLSVDWTVIMISPDLVMLPLFSRCISWKSMDKGHPSSSCWEEFKKSLIPCVTFLFNFNRTIAGSILVLVIVCDEVHKSSRQGGWGGRLNFSSSIAQ